MFLYVYVEYLALYKPGQLAGLLAGQVHDFQLGPGFISVALTLMVIPILMILASVALPAPASRIANLVVAAIQIPLAIFNAVGEPLDYAYFYVLSIGCELLILAYILRTAWTWPPHPRTEHTPLSWPLAGARAVTSDSTRGPNHQVRTSREWS